MGASALLPFAVVLGAALVAAILARRLWVDRPPRARGFTPHASRDLVAAAVVWLALMNVIGGAVRAASASDEALFGADVIALVVAHALFLVILTAYFRARYGATTADLGFKRPKAGDIVLSLLVYVASLPAFLAAAALTRVLSGDLPVQRSVELLRESTFAERALLSIAAVITAPVAEELLFRGIVFGALRGAVGLWPAVVFSSVLFGLTHVDAAMGPLVWLGAVLALVYERTGSLWAPIAVHSAHNAIMVLLVSFTSPESAPGVPPA